MTLKVKEMIKRAAMFTSVKSDADFFSADSKQIKSKGLQRLRWYCQSCNKQMRDENGFKCHIATEGHQRQMQLFSENSGAYIESYSSQFLSAFTRLISSRYSQKPVLMNTIYQEYIQDKQHMHMNATRWSSFRDLANYMKKKGLCDYEDSDRGIIITWIDNSPHALERRAAMEKKEKSERSEEERAQLMLEEQMEKAKKNLVNEKETVREKKKIES
ncbi:hypothetical protein HDU92_007914 [Lobulomyces angularis]|nr:hypothetical protein HDU92_007914 [Lobulomyces angularis]